MNWEQYETIWTEYKGLAKKHWMRAALIAVPLLVLFLLVIFKDVAVAWYQRRHDPVKKAEAVSAKQAEVREKAEAAARESRDSALERLEADRAADTAKAVTEAERELERLQKSPQELVERMKRQGRGQ